MSRPHAVVKSTAVRRWRVRRCLRNRMRRPLWNKEKSFKKRRKRPEGSVKEGLNRSLEHLGLCSESAGKASESFEQI